MKWSYYCVQPDENSIRVYIYNQDTVCYYRVFKRDTFQSILEKNKRNGLIDINFSYDIFCNVLNSNDIHFEILKGSERQIKVKFMYRVIYTYNDFEWVMKMSRHEEFDKFITPILTKQKEKPEKVSSIDVISACLNIYNSSGGNFLTVGVLKIKNEHPLFEYVYNMENQMNPILEYLSIDENFGKFLIEFNEKFFEVYLINFPSEKKDECKTTFMQNISALNDYIEQRITLKELNKLENLRTFTGVIQGINKIDFRPIDFYLKKYYQVENKFERGNLFFNNNFGKIPMDVRFNNMFAGDILTHDMKETLMRLYNVPIKIKDYLPLFYENISQLFFSQAMINFLNEKYGENNADGIIYHLTDPLRRTPFYPFSYTTYYLKNSNKIKNYEIIDNFRNTTKLILDYNCINDYIVGIFFLPIELYSYLSVNTKYDHTGTDINRCRYMISWE